MGVLLLMLSNADMETPWQFLRFKKHWTGVCGREGRRRSGHKTKPASRPWEGFKERENLLRPRAANELPARSEEVRKQANEWGSGKKEEKKHSRRPAHSSMPSIPLEWASQFALKS